MMFGGYRFTPSPLHSDEMMEHLVGALQHTWNELGIPRTHPLADVTHPSPTASAAVATPAIAPATAPTRKVPEPQPERLSAPAMC